MGAKDLKTKSPQIVFKVVLFVLNLPVKKNNLGSGNWRHIQYGFGYPDMARGYSSRLK